MVIFPNNTELYDTLRNLDDIKGTLVIWVGLEERLERDRKLGQRLMGLSGTSALAHAMMKTSINLPHLLELGLGGKNHSDVVGFSCGSRVRLGEREQMSKMR